MAAITSSEAELLQLLHAQRDHLMRALHKLEESNAQLKEAMREEKDDDYKAAVEENIVVIAKFRC